MAKSDLDLTAVPSKSDFTNRVSDFRPAASPVPLASERLRLLRLGLQLASAPFLVFEIQLQSLRGRVKWENVIQSKCFARITD